jgi:hypothetical protein
MKLQTNLITFQFPPYSLVWEGDTLVDWRAGGNRYELDETFKPSNLRFSPNFNGVVALPDSRCIALFECRWTKGLLLPNEPKNPQYNQIQLGERVFSFLKMYPREINRSYYQAHEYEYPIALFYLPDGRAAILHCPDEYCRLEIELIETGERLTASDSRKSDDVFHSRLLVSPSGRYALSAGWVWHPIDVLCLFDLHRAIEDPSELDKGITVVSDAYSAVFLDDDIIAYSISSESRWATPGFKEKSQVNLYSIEKGTVVHSIGIDQGPLSLLPTDNRRYVWEISSHVKLLDLDTGEVLAECPQAIVNGSIGAIDFTYEDFEHPPFALHPDRRRLAVGTKEGIALLVLLDTEL